MSDFSVNKLRQLDVTILLVFVSLLRTKKAQSTASELGLTTSAISHILKRLRLIFDDELFIRKPHGLEPTAYANLIEPDIRLALNSIQSALVGDHQFDPATADATIRISARDREITTLIPILFERMQSLAPNIRLSVSALEKSESKRRLVEGTLDFAIGYFNQIDHELSSYFVREESYCVLAHEDHEIFKEELTIDRYVQFDHIIVAADGSLTGIVDMTLKGLNLARSVKLSIPSFLACLSVLSKTNLIATVPSSLAGDYSDYLGLKACPPPVKIRSFNVSLLFHHRNKRSPIHKWFLSILQDIEGL